VTSLIKDEPRKELTVEQQIRIAAVKAAASMPGAHGHDRYSTDVLSDAARFERYITGGGELR
jgi:hypothetical protein